MKKNFILVLFTFLFVHMHAQSFDSKNIRAGAGLCFATNIDNIGLLFNGTYEITEQWEAALTFTHIFENDYIIFNILDMDAHYVFFEDGANIHVYGLAGLSFNFWKVVWPPVVIGGITINDETITKGTDVGLNLGVAMNYKINEVFSIVPELRATLSEDSFVRIGVALQYAF